MIFKLIAFFAVLGAASAGHLSGHGTPIFEEFNSRPDYTYAYGVEDSITGDSKSQIESRDGDLVHGEYSLNDADGYRRTVKYTADSLNGFNAVVDRKPLVEAAPLAVETVEHVEAPLAVEAVRTIEHIETPLAVKTIEHVEAPLAVRTIEHVETPLAVKAIEHVPAPVFVKNIEHIPAPILVKSIEHRPAPVVLKSFEHVPAPTFVKTVAPVTYTAPPLIKSLPITYTAPSFIKSSAPIAYAAPIPIRSAPAFVAKSSFEPILAYSSGPAIHKSAHFGYSAPTLVRRAPFAYAAPWAYSRSLPTVSQW